MDMITAEEKVQLEERLKELVSNRPEVSKRIAEARALGDLKENAEYHAAREDQGMQEAEIRRLEERLKNASVVDNNDIPDDMVFLGSTVTLKQEGTEDEKQYKIVGEASGSLGGSILEVTASSPLGESLMKARVGETVAVKLRRGTKRFEVVRID